MEILYFALLAYLSFFIFKPKGILSCGLFGYAGSKEANIFKIKILGIYNDTRGGDSCGIFLNDKVHKTATVGERNFFDYIQSLELKSTEDNHVIIGHTRKNSVGGISLENAHPFRWKYPKTGNDVIFAHNGTLMNWQELKTEFKLSDKSNTLNTDSKVLGKLLSLGKTDVLLKYRGAAAIIMTDTKTPNSIYLWRGASIQTTYVNAKAEEERPLYYMLVDGGVYVSSLEESLKAIAESQEEKDSITLVPENTLMHFVNGEIVTQKVFDRSEVRKYVSYNNTSSHTRHSSVDDDGDTAFENGFYGYGYHAQAGFKRNRVYKKQDEASGAKKIVTENSFDFITADTLSTEEQSGFGDCVYWKKGRFWQKDLGLLTGVLALTNEGKLITTNLNKEGRYYFFINGIILDFTAVMDADGNEDLIRRTKEFNALFKAYKTVVLNSNATEKSLREQIKNILVGKTLLPFEVCSYDSAKIKDSGAGFIYHRELTKCYDGNFTLPFARKGKITVERGTFKSFEVPTKSITDVEEAELHAFASKDNFHLLNFSQMDEDTLQEYVEKFKRIGSYDETFWCKFPFETLDWHNLPRIIHTVLIAQFRDVDDEYFETVEENDFFKGQNIPDEVMEIAIERYAEIKENEQALIDESEYEDEEIDYTRKIARMAYNRMEEQGPEFWEMYPWEKVNFETLSEKRILFLKDKLKETNPEVYEKLGWGKKPVDAKQIRHKIDVLQSLKYSKGQIIREMNKETRDFIFENLLPAPAVFLENKNCKVLPDNLPLDHPYLKKLVASRKNTYKTDEEIEEELTDEEVEATINDIITDIQSAIAKFEDDEDLKPTPLLEKWTEKLRNTLIFLEEKTEVAWEKSK